MKITFKLLAIILCSTSQILAQSSASLPNRGVIYHESIEVLPGLMEEIYISEKFNSDSWEIQIDIVLHGAPVYIEGQTKISTELIIKDLWSKPVADMTLNFLSSWVLDGEIAEPDSNDVLEKSVGKSLATNNMYLTSLFTPMDYNRELSGVLSSIPNGFGPRVRIF